MKLERLQGGTCAPPFPVHDDLVARLIAAPAPGAAARADARDPTAAHVLATCAGYSYADAATVAMVAARLGLGGNACVRVRQTVDAMFSFSTAFLVQSRCGCVVVLCYRGTEAMNFGNWFGDADVGPHAITLGRERLGVHAGFYRNLRATRWAVIEELTRALEGRSLLDHTRHVEHSLEALYVTGHSLGGAMAVLFALSLAGTVEHRALAERLRAVYTFGQPMAALEPLPGLAGEVGRAVFRHVTARDLVPALPPAAWGPFAHVGHEYRLSGGVWQRSEAPIAQLRNVREIPRSFLAFFATCKHRASSRYALGEHGPHHYIAALRPPARVTEFGDRD